MVSTNNGSSSPSLGTRDSIEQQRDEKRAKARMWHKRRREKVHQLHEQVAAYERVAVALPLVADAEHGWDEFLDEETRRMRTRLQQLGHARDVRGTLLAQNRQLQRLLTEHKLASEAVRHMLYKATHVDDWTMQVERWKKLTRARYEPRKVAQCLAELNAAMLEARTFTYSQDKQTSGLRFMGWEDSRRMDPSKSSFHFSLHKTYRGYDLDHQTSMGWRMFTDSTLYSKHVIGNRGRAAVEVVQRLSPSLLIVLFHEAYTNMDVTFHALALIATVETSDGVIQFTRSLDAPDLVSAFDSPREVWVSKSYWKQFDVLDHSKPRHATDFRASMRGTIRGQDLSYVNLWLFELLATVVRSEPFLTGRSMLTF